MCKQKRRGMIYLAGRDNVLHGSRSLKVYLTRGLEFPLPFIDNNKHLSKLYFMLSLWFQNLESSSTWFNPCFPLRRAFLLLYVQSVYLLLSILEANTCVNCVHWFLHAYLWHLLYYFVLTIIHEIYMLKVERNCWNLNLPLCCFKTFY